jgi:hypothetical protein
MLLENKSNGCTYQELPSGIVIEKHQILFLESDILIPNQNNFSHECVANNVKSEHGLVTTPKILISNSPSVFKKIS